MSAAIAKLLTEFDANGRSKPAEKPTDKSKAAETAAKPKEAKREPVATSKPEAPVNPLDDAYRRGYAAGMAETEAKIAEERVRGAVKLGEERARWLEQEAAAIANGFAAACRELESNVASSVARILQLFLADAVREKAVAALVEQISALTCDSSVPVFRVSGPGDLLELVKAQLGAERMDIEYQIADDAFEVRVVADQTVIETQMSAWIKHLKEARR